MKTVFVMPVSIALIGFVFIGVQQSTISALKAQQSVIKQQIKAALHTKDFPSGKWSTANPGGPIDWQLQLSRIDFSNPNSQTLLALQRKLRSMSADGIAAEIDQIKALDLDEQTERNLLLLVAQPLIEKDPQLALEKLAGDMKQDDYLVQLLAGALGSWANEDLALATAWLDEKIATGAMDAKSLDGTAPRTFFESTLIDKLLATDIESAKQRLQNLTEADRAQAIGFASAEINADSYSAYASLIRSEIPAARQALLLSAPIAIISRQRGGGYEDLAKYMQQIAPEPDQYGYLLAESGSSQVGHHPITDDDLNKFRQWSDTLAPEETNDATGKLLARQAMTLIPYQDAAQMALSFQESTGNDDVLIEFLRGRASKKNRTEAIEFAKKITDPIIRQQILESLKP
ncbi:hypothetical protein JIN85_13870 [Luteolibacter pohnpeiensis]|uniref:Uncharacterized protein n=1 Tax=Luteolibacter pohnpeiensis TaxID=454153 RepID=A0A934S5K1_9BACT|nr:hypothetical protein [Luteolibacter pohnpeiensis]MBK1883510.1 hypothetical protein [Luteolibacter pohnpeiensis]